MYVDKLDGVIDENTYKSKFAEFTKEKTNIASSIQRHINSDIKYYELGVNIFELSQRASEIFSKATQDQKRELLHLVFEKILLDKLPDVLDENQKKNKVKIH